MYVKGHGAPEARADLPVSSSSWIRVALEVSVTTGQLELGFYSEAAADQWINVDDVRVVETY